MSALLGLWQSSTALTISPILRPFRLANSLGSYLSSRPSAFSSSLTDASAFLFFMSSPKYQEVPPFVNSHREIFWAGITTQGEGVPFPSHPGGVCAVRDDAGI